MRGLLHDFYRELSLYAAIPFLYASVTANQVTLLSIVFGLVAAFYYSVGTFWGYIIAILFFAMLDFFIQKIPIYPFNLSYLMVFIVIQIIARTSKLFLALYFHLVKSNP